MRLRASRRHPRRPNILAFSERTPTGYLIIPIIVLVLGLLLVAGTAWTQEAVPLDSDRWNVAAGELTERGGRECLAGAAVLSDVEFENGIIEVDLLTDGSRSYPGIVFRLQSQENYERVYIRPHRGGLYPDAVQYTPIFNRIAGWQLYNGEGYTAIAEFPEGEWFTLKLEVKGSQARVLSGDSAEPVLQIHELKHGVSRGSLGLLGPADETACFSNFRYTLTDDLAFDPPAVIEASEGTIIDWEISRMFPAPPRPRDVYPRFYTIYFGGWEKVTAEPTGLVDIARYRQRTGQSPELVLARTIVRAEQRQEITLSFGYSDEIDLFFNGNKVFYGNSAYRHRDPSFLGVVGPFDEVRLTLEKGLNEIFLMVAENFGGWGFMARADRELLEPIKEHHRVEQVWATDSVFLTPETVIYDDERDLLYVSNFDVQFGQKAEPSGYISKLTADGEIVELEWVSGLNAPTGMGIHDGKLYTTERRTLTEIDLESGEVLNRYEIPDVDFPNDLSIDADGSIYISDTRPSSRRDSRIYRFNDGKFEIWLDHYDVYWSNGLYIHGGELLIGNSGDGMVRAVDLETKRMRDVISLGAGIIDGFRAANSGDLLMSHWEGQVYIVSPEGEIVEIMDTIGNDNAADFEYIKERNLLILPTFVSNRVVAYRVIE
jgi:sugar lactone lactonase YvrE